MPESEMVAWSSSHASTEFNVLLESSSLLRDPSVVCAEWQKPFISCATCTATAAGKVEVIRCAPCLSAVASDSTKTGYAFVHQAKTEDCFVNQTKVEDCLVAMDPAMP